MKSISLAILMMILQPTFAITVTDEESLRARIAEAKPLPFDTIREIFKNSPDYKVECVPDSNSAVVDDSNEEQVRIANLIPNFKGGQISFYLDPAKFGFNVFALKDFDGESANRDNGCSLECVGADSLSCGSLTLNWKETVGAQDPVEFVERFEIKSVNARDLYATFTFTAQVGQRNFWGHGIEVGHKGFSRSYLCALTPGGRHIERSTPK